jgi:S1-C subfamily serine protease
MSQLSLKNLPAARPKLGRGPSTGGGSVGGTYHGLDDEEHRLFTNSLNGVVQVFLQSVEPSFVQPWTKDMPESSTGTGFVIDLHLRLIATNAHCCEFARTILLRKNGDHDQYEAQLLTISHQVDIAILTVPNDKFWDGAVAIPFGELCRMQQTVNVIGYPIGGETISITRGVVSRIDWIGYAQSGGEGHLGVQVDAAINPGNSGGPAVSNGKLVGIAFQGMNNEEAANVGYIIPVTVLARVLDDFKESATAAGISFPTESAHSKHSKPFVWPSTKKPNIPLVILRRFARFLPRIQEAESPYLRKAVQLPDHMSGVVVRSIPETSNLCKVLHNNDVLVAVDGVSIGNEGRVTCPPLQPLDFQYLISSKLVGEPITFSIYRKGHPMEVTSTAENPPHRIPLISKDPFVSYVMFAGLVFSPLSNDAAIAENEIEDFIMKKEAELLLAVKKKAYTHVGQQCVVLTSILPHGITIGYQRIQPMVPLFKIDDHEIDNITDVAKSIANARGPLITLEFCNDDVIVLPLREAVAATAEIQEDFGMASAVSRDISGILTTSKRKIGHSKIQRLRINEPAAEPSKGAAEASSDAVQRDCGTEQDEGDWEDVDEEEEEEEEEEAEDGSDGDGAPSEQTAST